MPSSAASSGYYQTNMLLSLNLLQGNDMSCQLQQIEAFKVLRLEDWLHALLGLFLSHNFHFDSSNTFAVFTSIILLIILS